MRLSGCLLHENVFVYDLDVMTLHALKRTCMKHPILHSLPHLSLVLLDECSLVDPGRRNLSFRVLRLECHVEGDYSTLAAPHGMRDIGRVVRVGITNRIDTCSLHRVSHAETASIFLVLFQRQPTRNVGDHAG